MSTITHPIEQPARYRSADRASALDRAIGAVNQVLAQIGAVSRVKEESESGLFGVALEGRFGQAYNEEAFRYFLGVEQKRAERSGRSLMLLLVDLKRTGEDVNPAVAAKLFASLWLCLRETDFMGWYQSERVAGAVLTHVVDGCETDLPQLIRRRVHKVLSEALPPDVADGLHVRVQQLLSGKKVGG